MPNLFDIYAPTGDLYCRDCVCRDCCRRQTGTCPYGGTCFDDYRAKLNPCPNHTGSKSERDGRPYYDEVKDKWCVFGSFYPVHGGCEYYLSASKKRVVQCLETLVEYFPDGVMICPLADAPGCEWCYDRLMQKADA